MESVWKRLQRVNKRAAKFQFTASYHELRLETTAKWRPSNLSVVWTRRSRRVVSSPLPWEPDMMNPLIGKISWSVPDNHAISVTLFKDSRTHELEDKDWTFILEDITSFGKKRVLANASINMRKYASIESTQQSFTLNLKPVSRKISAANLELTISCVFLREGKATDEDMQSVVSFMSVNNNCDVAPLDDLEDMPDLENFGDISDHLYDFTQQLEELTTSLNGCSDIPTPISVPSLSEDPTPLAEPTNHLKFELEEDQDLSEISDNSLKTISQPPNKNTIAKPFIDQEKPSDYLLKQNDNITEGLISDISKINKVNSHKFDNEDSSEMGKSKELAITDVNPSSNVYFTPQSKTNIDETEKLVVSNAKRADLQPLNLKKNYDPIITLNNSENQQYILTDTDSTLKPVDKIVLKENTPGQDLLEWCKEVTKDYPNVKVTNLTTSWRNGMAFCAIIHHFVPHLIDMSKLSSHEVVGNCRTAFDAAESLGIPRVIEPRDMNLLTVPDKLAVMTYLHQLRAHFTGKQLKIEQIGTTSDESSYVIGNYKSDNLSQNLVNFSHHIHQNSIEDDIFGLGTGKPQQQSMSKRDVKSLILSSSKNILGKVLSPSKDKNSINSSHHLNVMLTDPHGLPTLECRESYNADEPAMWHESSRELVSPTTLEPHAANRILTRHKEMSEKAKLMMEKLKVSNNSERSDINDEERKQRLRDQARRLIIETRNKTGGDSHATPTKAKHFNFTSERTVSPINIISNNEEFYLDAPSRDPSELQSNKITSSHRLSERNANTSPLQSFNGVLERISPTHEKKGDKLSYIESELEALEREQEAIDKKASTLEGKLRAVMGGNPKTEETEEQLLSQWFTLVNKKNALLRRQMQLNILEQEKDLERKCSMLNQELRAAQSVEDWRKTEIQREKERLLLEELVSIVDKRNQLVQDLHNQEIAIKDDHEIEKELEQVDISGGKEKCAIQ